MQKRTFEALRDAIFAGELRPGDSLREMHLSRELQVSQAPVREALLQLEQLGLVVREPNRGTTVTRLASEEIRERIAIPLPLEDMAWQEASRRLTPEGFRTLDERLQEIARTVAEDDYFGCAQADLRFHRTVWEWSGNRTLCRTLESLTAPLFAFVSIVRSSGSQRLRAVVDSHEEVVAALRSRDAGRIHDTVRRHLQGSYATFLGSGAEDVQSLAQEGR